jgi:hypothetical protein
MPPVAIAVRRYRPVDPIVGTPSIRPQSRMMFYPDEGSGQPVLIPYAPLQLKIDEDAGTWSNISRAGLPDLVLYNKPKLRVLTFTLVLVDKAVQLPGVAGGIAYVQPAMDVYTQLKAYANAGTRMRLAYSSMEAGSWRITTMSVNTLRRDPLTSEVTHMTADMVLTQASDLSQGAGPVTGGASQPQSLGIGGVFSTSTSPNATTYYTTVAGDTLWAISLHYYGNGERYTTIADANNITDPRALPAGSQLRIP